MEKELSWCEVEVDGSSVATTEVLGQGSDEVARAVDRYRARKRTIRRAGVMHGCVHRSIAMNRTAHGSVCVRTVVVDRTGEVATRSYRNGCGSIVEELGRIPASLPCTREWAWDARAAATTTTTAANGHSHKDERD